MSNILVIDDEQEICQILSHAIKRSGHEPTCVHTLQEGLQHVRDDHVEGVLLDVRMPDGNGLDYLSSFLQASSSPEVIIMTGAGDPDGAELALTKGAFDYVQKPASINEIMLPLVRALEYREARLKRQKKQVLSREGIIGNSPALNECLHCLGEAAVTDQSVLITGETGTGKELFARALHENSARADRNFVVVDCAALTESLVESTLFGHVKGSFTGAISNHEGLIAAAHGGTLFLDEVGELSLDTQKKFLRVMEEKRFRPVGAKKEIESDFRLVAATNRDLEAMVQRNEFRNDLLYRIRSQEIHLPPLRERVEDVPEMVYYYINRICERMDLDIKKFHPEFLEILTDYHWPGNVRELVNTLEQALSGAVDESYLHQRHLPLHMRISYLRNSLDISSNSEPVLSDSASPLSSDPVPDWKSYREYINQQAEDRYFRDLYLHTGGKVKEMAELSGLTESRIYGILKKHNISKKSE